jgi:hypothetical protein
LEIYYETVFKKKKSEGIKINTDRGDEEQKKPGQKKSQLRQWHTLISVLSSVRQQQLFTSDMMVVQFTYNMSLSLYLKWDLVHSKTTRYTYIHDGKYYGVTQHAVCGSVLNLLPQIAEVL